MRKKDTLLRFIGTIGGEDLDQLRIRPILKAFFRAWERPNGPLRRELIQDAGCHCPLCNTPLLDDGRKTEIDHIWSYNEAINAVLDGTLTFKQAYDKLWSRANLRALCMKCNRARNRKSKEENNATTVQA